MRDRMGALRFSRLFVWLCLLALVLSCLPLSAQAAQGHFTRPPADTDKIDTRLAAELAGSAQGRRLGVIVRLKAQLEPGNLSDAPGDSRQSERLIRALQGHARQQQVSLRAWLKGWQAQGLADPEISFWLFNGLALKAAPEVIRRLAERPEVQSIMPDAIDVVPVGWPAVPSGAADNLSAIQAPALWDLGYFGQGVVIASLDTGVSLNHSDLAARWRGGSNSWFDPYGQHASPADLSGHGTQVMGVMVGGAEDGVALGVAPQAQWIAARIFDDQGKATASAIHLAYQWLLDPDGNPGTLDAPQVVNNSWDFSAPGCNLEFQADLKTLRAAGILPVFAAGNYGPVAASSPSPANYPEVLSVGNIDRSDQIDLSSSRGPAQCGEKLEAFPKLVAPGVDIRTTDSTGLYTNASGTSLAAPHAAGGLALLLSAFPGLSVGRQEHALLDSAADLGQSEPDQTFGFGRLNLLAAYHYLQESHSASPQLLFENGFEGGVQGWTTLVVQDGRLLATPAAALRGAAGLQALLDRPGSLYVQDDTPAGEARYNVRFYFAPNGVQIDPRQAHDLFTGLDAAGVALLRIQLRGAPDGNGYELRAASRPASGPSLATAWIALTDAVHVIEVHWRAASSPRASDGELSLWIDGRPAGALHGLANGGRLDSARLGPQNVGAGVAGSEYFDAFVSARSGYLGP